MSGAEVPPRPTRPAAAVYDAAYATVPNWDIGRPQRAFVTLAERGLVRGPVLDVGCGTGELSLFLARRGHEVLGVDISARAVAEARAKARWRRIAASFLVWDALELAALRDLGFGFRTVLDCAMFHVLRAPERERYVDELRALLDPGAAVFLLGDARPDPRTTYGVTPAELRARFADGWEVVFVADSVFERQHSRNAAYFAGVVRR